MGRKSSIRTLFRGSSILMFALAFDLGISFLGKLLIAQYLGRFDFGAVAVGVTFLSFSSQILTIGLDTGVSRYIPRSDDDEFRRRVVHTGLLLVIPISVTFGVVSFLSADWIAMSVLNAPQAVTIIRIFSLTVPFATVGYLAIGVVRGLQRAVPGAIIKNIIIPLSRILLLALGVVAGFEATEMSTAYALPFVFAALVGGYYLQKSGLVGIPSWDELMIRDLLAFSAPLVLSATMSRILSDVDTFIISRFSSTGDVGIYNVVYPSAQLVISTLTAFGFIFLPLLSELHAEGAYDDMQRIYQLSTKWLVFLTVPISFALAVFPTVFLRYTFGAEYVPGSVALAILVVGFTTHIVMGMNGYALTSIGRTKTIALDNAVIAAINVALNFLLIPPFSFVGAAVATALSYSLMNVMYGIQLFRSTGIQPLKRNTFVPSLLSLLIGTAYVVVLPDSFTHRLPSTVVLYVLFLVVYGLSILRFGGIESEDVMLVNDLEHKLDVDLEPLKRTIKRFM